MHITRYEKETIILFNDAEPTASIYTCNKKLLLQLEKNALDFPNVYSLVKEDLNSKTYAVAKKYIALRRPRVLTPEQKQKKRDHFKNIIKNNSN